MKLERKNTHFMKLLSFVLIALMLVIISPTYVQADTNNAKKKSCCLGHKITCITPNGKKLTYPNHALLLDKSKKCDICGKSITCHTKGIKRGNLFPGKDWTCTD